MKSKLVSIPTKKTKHYLSPSCFEPKFLRLLYLHMFKNLVAPYRVVFGSCSLDLITIIPTTFIVFQSFLFHGVPIFPGCLHKGYEYYGIIPLVADNRLSKYIYPFSNFIFL